MPRDSGDDAYAWMAARENATTTVEIGSTWRNKRTRRHVVVMLGGFLPSYEPSDSRVLFHYQDVKRKRSCVRHIADFVKEFEQ